MRYYLYDTDSNHYRSIGVSGRDDSRVMDLHYGDVPAASSWKPPVSHSFPESPPKQGDFPSMNNYSQIPVFSQRAWDVLRTLPNCRWEALPIIHPTGKPFYVIHVMETIDCLDLDRSKVERLDDGRIFEVASYCLRTDMLQGKHIFKIPLGTELSEDGLAPPLDLLVDDVFREVVERNGLKGLLFREIPMAEPL